VTLEPLAMVWIVVHEEDADLFHVDIRAGCGALMMEMVTYGPSPVSF
jgi:hypothetical protein